MDDRPLAPPRLAGDNDAAVRVHAFRMWFGATVRQGIGAAKRAGFAVTKRVRASLGKIEGASGVGDEEMDVKGGGARAWWDVVGEAAHKVRAYLEANTFVRIGKLEAWVRSKLGMPPRLSKAALAQPARSLPMGPQANRRGPGRGSTPLDPEQAARLRAQVQLLRTQANTSRGSAPSAGAIGVATVEGARRSEAPGARAASGDAAPPAVHRADADPAHVAPRAADTDAAVEALIAARGGTEAVVATLVAEDDATDAASAAYGPGGQPRAADDPFDERTPVDA